MSWPEAALKIVEYATCPVCTVIIVWLVMRSGAQIEFADPTQDKPAPPVKGKP